MVMSGQKQFIKQVWQNRTNKQKCVTIPKGSDIEPGDYVLLRKVEEKAENEAIIKA